MRSAASPAPHRAGWRALCRELVGIDLRSLAALRLGLALVILFDLASRAANLRAHYTDFGILPRSAALIWLPVEAHLSIYMLDGRTGFAALLFLITALAAVALAAGWHTRVATIVCWYLELSLQVRNPAIDHGGDNILRLTLFWAMFLPLGDRWSCDRAAGRQREPADPVVSVAAFAARLQVCLIYWTSAVFKWGPAWLGGDAIATALRVDHLSTAWGRQLLNFPRFLSWATRATLAFEILGPVAAWSPFATGPVRSVVVLGFVLFHLCGLNAAMRLGTFPWVCAVVWTLFVPSWLWERLASGPIGRLMAALDRRDCAGADLPDRAAAEPSGPGHHHRAAGGRPPKSSRGRLLGDAAAALLLVFLLLLNLREAGFTPPGPLPPVAAWLSQASSLHQRWNMFSTPPSDDGWIVAAGRTRGGRAVDAWRRGALDFSRPEPLVSAYGDSRWSKYLFQLPNRDYVHHRRLFGNYLCRRWNAERTGAEQLDSLWLFFMRETTLPPDRKLAAEPVLIFAQRCSDR